MNWGYLMHDICGLGIPGLVVFVLYPGWILYSAWHYKEPEKPVSWWDENEELALCDTEYCFPPRGNRELNQ